MLNVVCYCFQGHTQWFRHLQQVVCHDQEAGVTSIELFLHARIKIGEWKASVHDDNDVTAPQRRQPMARKQTDFCSSKKLPSNICLKKYKFLDESVSNSELIMYFEFSTQ